MKHGYKGWDEVGQSAKLNPNRRIPEHVAGVSGGRRRSQSEIGSFQVSELFPSPLCEGCPELTPLLNGAKAILNELGGRSEAGVVYYPALGRAAVPHDAMRSNDEVASLVEEYRALEAEFQARADRCHAAGLGLTVVQAAEVQCGADEPDA